MIRAIAMIAFALPLFAQHPKLPDPKLTPGATDPRVTQANIKQTVCVANYTKKVRPPDSYTDKMKIRQMAERHLNGDTKAYEEDHLIPLIAGGSPTSELNLWPQPIAEARLKDHLEVFLHRQICSNNISLAEAQKEISTNWWAAYQKYGLKSGVKKRVQ